MLGGAQRGEVFRDYAFDDACAVWTSGPDFHRLSLRWKEEPELAESMVVTGLRARDPLAAQCLAFLPLSTAARDRMVEHLLDSAGAQPATFQLRVAEALHELTGDEFWSVEVIRVLLDAPRWVDRLEAAIALGSFAATAEVIEATVAAAHDPESLVRSHAAAALVEFVAEHYGIGRDSRMRPGARV